MPSENRTDPRKNFVPRLLPWLLALAMFAVYCVTLNRWVSPASLPSVTKISGWWLPEVLSPLLFLVTYPFRWLPEAQIPFALNLFSALCAALSLGLLARSVAILPQDRTDAQRRREKSDFSFLTTGSAWLPPLLAVVVCGLQLTFWQQATNYAGETFDLLIFAFLIWSLLEYRLDEREGRLFLASLVYGAGMAENWAMAGYFPLFLAAIIWIRGLSFFQWPFLKRMILCGLAGMLFYFLLPVVAALTSDVSITFWQALKFNLQPQYTVLKSYVEFIFHPGQNAEFLALTLAYLTPLFVLALRWKPSFGDSSKLGSMLTSFMFHLAHAAFLGLLIWMAFDPPFSPRHFSTSVTPLLTFYYLGALSIGYYAGYFLLIFGEKETAKRPARNSSLEFLDPVVFAAAWALSVIAIVGLVYRNAPQIKAANANTLWQYAELIAKSLPSSGGYLLSDDEQRLALVRAVLARDGRAKAFIPLDTESLFSPAYHRFLHRKYPDKWPQIVSDTQTNLLNPYGLIQVLMLLSKTNDLYYLHPSYGYYFEAFYAEPHGLAYKLKPLPEDTWLPPKVDGTLITENESFWAEETPVLDAVEKTIAPPDVPLSFGERLLKKFHIGREPDPIATTAGLYYSRCADFWGTQLQRAGDLEKAAAQFAMATNLNPDNLVAKINLDFNAGLRSGRIEPVDLSKTTPDHFGKFGTWNDLVNMNGPFDEPSFCFQAGINFMGQPLPMVHQAIAKFDRTRELTPNFLPARTELARAYSLVGKPDRALAVLQEPLEHPEQFSLDRTNETPLHVLAAAVYFQKNENARGAKLLESEADLHPEDNDLLTAVAQALVMRGLFTNALAVVDRKLKSSPDDLAWTYARGYICIRLGRYNDAISAFTRVLNVQTNNYNALFNRAIANLQADKLEAAKADYEKLQDVASNSVPVAYGLGEIARRQHDTNEAVRNYEIYLANTDTNTAEAKAVADRLNSLKH